MTEHSRPLSQPLESPATPAADWAALRLINQYRLLMLLALAAIYYLADDQRTLGSRSATLFEVSHLGYVVMALCFTYLIRRQRPQVEIQFFLQSYLDIIAICTLMYASGGVKSGLGPLLLINLALLSQIMVVRHAMLFAAISSTFVLSEELLIRLLHGPAATSFEATALLGALLFLTAWIMAVPLRKLTARQFTTPTSSRMGLDVKQIAQLNEEIIRELDSGVVVIDDAGEVQLINDTARILLSAEFTPIPLHIGRMCNELWNSINQARLSPTFGTRAFDIANSNRVILPQYIPLSTGGMLIKLDDHAHIRQQFQQLKLASLGRLSASIAHEIRNPLGAISHAVQLIQESPTLDVHDAELLKIADRHTLRINRIIEDVLQLSNRQRVNTELLNISQQIQNFAQRFRAENALPDEALECVLEADVQAVFDAEHLDQVLWNLCTNARLHNEQQSLVITISCWQSQQGLAVIDVVDNGLGISDMDRENIFEPFYSSHHSGTGLGLYIISELCELNKAKIDCLERESGAHFQILFSLAGELAA